MRVELALLASVAIGGWLALQALLADSFRREWIPLGLLGLSAALWAGGELVLLQPTGPDDLLFGRRLLYLGAAFLPASWLWVALQTARPRAYLRHPRLALLAWLPPLFFCSCLWWDAEGYFIGWTTPEPTHGPLFRAYVGYQWSLGLLGLFYFGRAALRLRRDSPVHVLLLAAGVLLPLLANVAYVSGLVSWDPSPAVLGPAGLLIWLAVVDSGLILHTPLGRSQVLEQIDVGVVVGNLEERAVGANRAARRWLGGGRERIGPTLDALERSARARTDAALEVQRVPLRGRMGRVGSALLVTDRTEAERTQRRLQLAARLEALGSLTAGIAHEVNNPLAYIQSNLSHIEKVSVRLSRAGAASSPELGEDAAELSEIVSETREGIERIQRLVARLTRFAGPEEARLRFAPVRVQDVAARAAAVAGVGSSPEAIRVAGGNAPPITTSEPALFQILVNLLVNAVQVSGEKAEVELRFAAHRDGVAVQVMDRGPGIQEKHLGQVFDPFFTTRPTGTGLGLSLSFGMARQLGGRLEAANRKDGGAVFTLWLPRESPVAPGAQPR